MHSCSGKRELVRSGAQCILQPKPLKDNLTLPYLERGWGDGGASFEFLGTAGLVASVVTEAKER